MTGKGRTNTYQPTIRVQTTTAAATTTTTAAMRRIVNCELWIVDCGLRLAKTFKNFRFERGVANSLLLFVWCFIGRATQLHWYCTGMGCNCA